MSHPWRRACGSCIVAFVIAVAGRAAFAQPSPAVDPPTRQMRLDRVAERLAAEGARLHVPGFSVAVVLDDAVVMSRGFGLRNVDATLPATDETIYAVGSTTKAFTVALAAMLVDDGALNWDDPVRTHLPGFTLHDPAADEQVVLRDLLSHRIGLMTMDLLWYAGDSTWDDMQAAIARAEPVSEFRTAFHYNNPMYLAAGLAVADAAGRDWHDLVRERIFVPLHMTATRTTVAEVAGDEHLALGYEWNEDDEAWRHLPMRPLGNIAPAGAINSNVRDMAQWIRLLLNRGEIDGATLIDDEQFDVMWEAQIAVGPGTDYALGWMVGRHGERRVIQHSGGIDGFTAHVCLLPDDGLGFVLLTNANGSMFPTAATGIVIDTMLGPWVDETLAATENGLEKYAGAYRFDAMGVDLTVAVKDGGLTVDVPGQMVFALEPPADDGRRGFRGFPDIAVSFDEDDDRVVAMNLFQSGLTFELPRAGVERAPDFDEIELRPYLGRYRFEEMNAEVEVLVKDGRLGVDVPGQMVYELHPPDDDGRWLFRVTADASVVFDRDENGVVTAMRMNQRGMESVLARMDTGADVPLPTVEEVMALVHEENGAERYARVENLDLAGRIEFVNQGVIGTTRTLAAGFDRFWQRIDLGPFGWIQSSMVGRFAWSDSAFEPFTELDDRLRRQLLTQHPAALLGPWAPLYDSIEILGREDRDGRELLVLRVTAEDLPPTRLFIGAEDGRLHRSEGKVATTTAEISVTTTYGDYRDVAGVMFPFRVEMDHQASGRVVIEITAARVNQDLPDEPWFMNETPNPRLPSGG